MLILVLKNLQLEKLSKIKQWLIIPHRCSVFLPTIPSCPRRSHASVFHSSDPSTNTLLCALLISPCPRLAPHVWLPTARKGSTQTLRPLLKEKAQPWPWTKHSHPLLSACVRSPAQRRRDSQRHLVCFLLPGTYCLCVKAWSSETQRFLNVWIRCRLFVLQHDLH